jgi:hypothetical protein
LSGETPPTRADLRCHSCRSRRRPTREKSGFRPLFPRGVVSGSTPADTVDTIIYLIKIVKTRVGYCRRLLARVELTSPLATSVVARTARSALSRSALSAGGARGQRPHEISLTLSGGGARRECAGLPVPVRARPPRSSPRGRAREGLGREAPRPGAPAPPRTPQRRPRCPCPCGVWHLRGTSGRSSDERRRSCSLRAPASAPASGCPRSAVRREIGH